MYTYITSIGIGLWVSILKLTNGISLHIKSTGNLRLNQCAPFLTIPGVILQAQIYALKNLTSRI